MTVSAASAPVSVSAAIKPLLGKAVAGLLLGPPDQGPSGSVLAGHEALGAAAGYATYSAAVRDLKKVTAGDAVGAAAVLKGSDDRFYGVTTQFRYAPDFDNEKPSAPRPYAIEGYGTQGLFTGSDKQLFGLVDGRTAVMTQDPVYTRDIVEAEPTNLPEGKSGVGEITIPNADSDDSSTLEIGGQVGPAGGYKSLTAALTAAKAASDTKHEPAIVVSQVDKTFFTNLAKITTFNSFIGGESSGLFRVNDDFTTAPRKLDVDNQNELVRAIVDNGHIWKLAAKA